MIYLTIDDAFSDQGMNILDFLIDNNIGALFFCTGRKIEKNNNNLQCYYRALKNGYIIGNHSYSHPNFHNLSLNESTNQVKKTEIMIKEIYKKSSVDFKYKLFRYPGGSRNQSFDRILALWGYVSPSKNGSWDWNIDLKDGKNINNELDLHIKNLCTGIKDGDIVLSHDCSKNIQNGLLAKLYNLVSSYDLKFATNSDIIDLLETL